MHPYSLFNKIVSQSAGSYLQAPHSPPGGQETEAVGGMGGIPRNAQCFARQAGLVGILEEGKKAINDPLGSSHYALQSPPTECGAAAVPHSDSAG